MKKIECRIYEYRMVMGETKSRWCFCREQEANEMIANPDVGLKGAMYEVRQLWTDDALQAVAEAVKKQCMEDAAAWSMTFVEKDSAPHGIDIELGKYVNIAAIINQLKGK